MPLYEYECGSCGTFEVIRRFSDPALTRCPKCGGKVEKLLSAPAIQFKGTGWYITDYSRKGAGESKSSEAAPSSTTEKAGPAKASGGSTGGTSDKS